MDGERGGGGIGEWNICARGAGFRETGPLLIIDRWQAITVSPALPADPQSSPQRLCALVSWRPPPLRRVARET